jgi:hypothetical protein
MKPLAVLALALGCSSLLHAADNERLVPMFNGRDLAGWTNVNCAPETWTIRDGMIISTGIPTGVLRTTRMYENFIVELEWRHMVAGGNAGFFVYSAPITAVGQPFTKGMEIQIIDRDHAQGWATRHGDVFSIHGATFVPDKPHPQGWQRSLPSEKRVKPQGEWNHYRVESRDGVLTVAVNGKVVSGGSNCVPRKGYICLESEGSECHFRNVRIQELPSSNPPASHVAEEDQGWMSLYNGLDLRGWKQEPGHSAHWQAKDWILDYDGKSATNQILWNEKALRDFELIVDWRLPGGANRKEVSPGTSTVRVRKSVEIPLALAEGAKASQWNRLRVTMRGQQMTARLNDKVFLEKTLGDAPPEGVFGLEHAGTPIQFANIYVRELK